LNLSGESKSWTNVSSEYNDSIEDARYRSNDFEICHIFDELLITIFKLGVIYLKFGLLTE